MAFVDRCVVEATVVAAVVEEASHKSLTCRKPCLLKLNARFMVDALTLYDREGRVYIPYPSIPVIDNCWVVVNGLHE